MTSTPTPPRGADSDPKLEITEGQGFFTGSHLRQADIAILGLGNNLLGDDEHIVGSWFQVVVNQ